MFDKIEKAFDPVTSSVYDYYQDPGVGLYIPLYQREYSWDSDNIDQLLDDLAKGVDNLIESPEREIRFLGTIIAVNIGAKQVRPLDRKALPGSVQNIIDGQQRLSTISLFSTLLYKYIDEYEKKVGTKLQESEAAAGLVEACLDWKKKLKSLFSLDLGRGTPTLKPKIIRGNKDQWTLVNGIEKYNSEVSSYLAHFINAVVKPDEFEYPTFKGKEKVFQNLRRIDRWLRRNIIPAHVSNDSDFAMAWEILRKVPEEYIWIYERERLAALTRDEELRSNSAIHTLDFDHSQLIDTEHFMAQIINAGTCKHLEYSSNGIPYGFLSLESTV